MNIEIQSNDFCTADCPYFVYNQRCLPSYDGKAIIFRTCENDLICKHAVDMAMEQQKQKAPKICFCRECVLCEKEVQQQNQGQITVYYCSLFHCEVYDDDFCSHGYKK